MNDFISTEAAHMLSFICQVMPNLKKSILKQSSTPIIKIQTPGFELLSADQIKEARQHPTGYVKQAINAVASVQKVIFTATMLIQKHTEQRDLMEKALTAIKEQKRIDELAAKKAMEER